MGDVTAWRKAARSNDQGGSCVEVAAFAGAVGLRDSKDPGGPKFLLAKDDFRALLAHLKQH
ncbi:DUF397 domain-containing protein [Actinomadura fibrosa]|uniref:DUF397 domain-containing protein n=1 Tax=Actinomadura fibrosa TaxID=111802 RepID=A0ABW2XWD3_9ACTN|nr:DUF397 domain-containing protein [Actinomadura fibrosa]